MNKVRNLAQHIAGHGRYGDTELLHTSKDEIHALEALNGAPLSRNPVTGAKEAFSLGKLLAGIGLGLAAIPTGGMSLLGGLGTLIGGGMASALPAIGGAIGAGMISSSMAPNQPKSNAQADMAAKNAEQAAKIHIPMVEMVSPLATQPGYIPGVKPEAQVAPSRRPIGYVQPNGNTVYTPGGGYAKGGSVEKAAAIKQAAIDALSGRSANPRAALEKFVEMFGEDQLAQLMQQMQNPPGGLLKGPGGAMDDTLPAKVTGGGPDIALSGDEYVVPGDVTSHLGDGSSTQGGRVLDAMVARVRQQKTGTTKQPGRINLSKVLPQ